MSPEERIEKIEQELCYAKLQVRWLLTLAGLVALAICVLHGWRLAAPAQAQAAGGSAKEIKADAFVVEDARGKVRIDLRMAKDGPRLSLLDENGKDRARLEVGKDGPMLALYDLKGHLRGAMKVDTQGAKVGMLNAKGKEIAGLRGLDSGAGLGLHDQEGNVRLLCAVTPQPPGLLGVLFYDKNGESLGSVTCDEEEGKFYVCDANGNPPQATSKPASAPAKGK